MATKIRYVGSEESREIAATGQVVERGHLVEIEDDELAKSLLKQAVWEKADKKKGTK